MKQVSSQDVQLRVEHTPRPGAPALLLINSLGTSLEMWDEQLEPLSERFELIRFDARGHGKSTSGAQPEATMDMLATDALNVLEACGVARAHLCGISLGGMIAMHIATKWPDKVLKAALCNTSSHMPPRDAWDARIKTVLSEGPAALAEGTLGRWFTPPFREAHPDKVERIRNLILETSPQGYAACCAAIRDMDQRESIRDITAKTLVIGGTADTSTPPAHAELIASRIPEAKLVLLEAAHLSNIERAAEFNATLIEFLQGELTQPATAT
ncbi:3-oxoadipate enol-lactonase [Steroidobacter sp.]|uniref:3-oxoadipate enol-lactonase n=1 Tax=Steroidobacter sp. TaxID=1978227 RepID=UPI001A47B282|nr:3-oxoadipate enol-lactonase [Steroidobacter sp.]MBL8266611.1 3-oxoadipate enol-lactonase [Steroidobacter sp.]